MPPDVVCPRCGTTAPDWTYVPVSGRGTVRSWTIVRQPFLLGLEVPYALVDVEVAEQPDLRLVGRLVDGPGAPIAVGAEVVTEFEARTADRSIPVFRLAAER
jgi:uncharacterized OB-fold protein